MNAPLDLMPAATPLTRSFPSQTDCIIALPVMIEGSGPRLYVWLHADEATGEITCRLSSASHPPDSVPYPPAVPPEPCS